MKRMSSLKSDLAMYLLVGGYFDWTSGTFGLLTFGLEASVPERLAFLVNIRLFGLVISLRQLSGFGLSQGLAGEGMSPSSQLKPNVRVLITIRRGHGTSDETIKPSPPSPSSKVPLLSPYKSLAFLSDLPEQ
jgi:hypothetical protein